jgi:PKD repeat protein
VTNSAAVQLAGDLTIELWVNVSLATRQTLISKSYLHEFELTLETNGVLNLYQGNGATYSNAWSAAGAVTANTWHHVVVTRAAATQTIRFYVDGVARGSGVSAIVPTAGPNGVSIGRSESGCQYVNGSLDEVALYAAVLTPTQIATHWAMRLANGVGTPVELPLVASDADGDALTYSAVGLPPGLAVNVATGLISGTLTAASAGIYPVTATVSDGRLAQSQSFTWTVTHVNHAPTLAVPANQASAETASIALQLAASDSDGDALTYSATGLPPSVSLDAATGLLTGTLPFGSAGTYLVTVTVADAAASASQTFTWTVTHTNRAPVLANPGVQSNADRWDYALAVRADAPVSYWRLGETAGTSAADSAGTNPGTLVGGVTPGQPGALADGNAALLLNGSTGYVRVTNSAAVQLAGDLTIELWVNVSLAARQTLISKHYLHEFELTLETNGVLNLYQGNGAAYSNAWSAAGAVTANTWHHVVVTREAATQTIRFYVDGVARGSGVSAIVPTAGPNAVSIGRSAGGSQYVNGSLDEVALYAAVLSPTQIATHWAMRVADGTGTPVALPLVASDPDGDALTYSAVGLPPGLAVNAATGLISGTLTAASAGIYPVTATASDGRLAQSQSFTWTVTVSDAAASTSQTFTWMVTYTNRAPVVRTNPAVQTAAIGWGKYSERIPRGDA